MASHIVEYPGMSPKRELKLAQEYFWDGKSSAGDLQKLEADLRESFRKLMGIEYISSNTFSCYDQAAALKGSDHRRATKVSDDDYVKAIEEIKKEIFSANAAAQASRKSSPRGQRCGGPILFAISRSPIPKPMMVKIMVNSHEYIALIDTGSTYNLLHPRVAREVGLEINKDDPIEVSIADGSTMCSEGSCQEFKFVIQGGRFATPPHILPLDGCGCDVILRIEWLMGLGDIKNWNFTSLKMELTQEGKTIQIKGMDTEESEAGCSTVEKLLSMVREGVKYGPGVYDIHSPRVPSTEEIKYGAGIGPGVFDIHSPRVPSTEEIADGINKMLAVLETIQVNPDCGLKTRKCTEVKPALKNKLLRSQLVSAK